MQRNSTHFYLDITKFAPYHTRAPQDLSAQRYESLAYVRHAARKVINNFLLTLFWVHCLVVRWFFCIRVAWCLLGTAAACGGARIGTAAARRVDGWRRGGDSGRVVGRRVDLLCRYNPRKHWETKKKAIFFVRMFGQKKKRFIPLSPQGDSGCPTFFES